MDSEIYQSSKRKTAHISAIDKEIVQEEVSFQVSATKGHIDDPIAENIPVKSKFDHNKEETFELKTFI